MKKFCEVIPKEIRIRIIEIFLRELGKTSRVTQREKLWFEGLNRILEIRGQEFLQVKNRVQNELLVRRVVSLVDLGSFFFQSNQILCREYNPKDVERFLKILIDEMNCENAYPKSRITAMFSSEIDQGSGEKRIFEDFKENGENEKDDLFGSLLEEETGEEDAGDTLFADFDFTKESPDLSEQKTPLVKNLSLPKEEQKEIQKEDPFSDFLSQDPTVQETLPREEKRDLDDENGEKNKEVEVSEGETQDSEDIALSQKKFSFLRKTSIQMSERVEPFLKRICIFLLQRTKGGIAVKSGVSQVRTRIVATILDAILLFPVFLFSSVAGAVFGFFSSVLAVIFGFVPIFIGFWYGFSMEAGTGATIGKKLCGIRVSPKTSGNLKSIAMKRNLFKLSPAILGWGTGLMAMVLPTTAQILGLFATISSLVLVGGLIYAKFQPSGQSFHDLGAGSVMVQDE